MKKQASLLDKVKEAYFRVLRSPEDEGKSWDGNSEDPSVERLRVMAAWIVRRRTDHGQASVDADIPDSSVLAAYKATEGVVITLGYEPSSEKKWAAKGRPTVTLTYEDGSPFDWER